MEVIYRSCTVSSRNIISHCTDQLALNGNRAQHLLTPCNHRRALLTLATLCISQAAVLCIYHVSSGCCVKGESDTEITQ